MGNCKVCVYTICKNEEKFVDRWMDSMGEADLVVVLDTGSKDGTVERLRARERRSLWSGSCPGGSTRPATGPWNWCRRMWTCVSVPTWMRCSTRDGGRRWNGPGGLGAAGSPIAIPGASSRIGSEGLYSGAIRSTPRRGYRWVHPVHEVLQWEGRALGAHCGGGGGPAGPPPGSGKIPGQYLPLLELSVEEDPEDDRNMHSSGPGSTCSVVNGRTASAP